VNKRELFTGLAVSVALLAAASATACADDSQVGNGLGGDGTSGNHSVLVQTVNGVTTVVVDGKMLTGEEAEQYIN
jgi:hypothetical protein